MAGVFSEPLKAEVATTNMDQAPGSGSFEPAPFQFDNSTVKGGVRCPETDFDGTGLTGLRRRNHGRCYGSMHDES